MSEEQEMTHIVSGKFVYGPKEFVDAIKGKINNLPVGDGVIKGMEYTNFGNGIIWYMGESGDN